MPEETTDRRYGARLGEEAGALLRITLSPSIWALHFVLVYASTAIVCSKLTGGEVLWMLRVGIGALTVAALLAIALVGWRSWVAANLRGDGPKGATPAARHRFLGLISLLLSVISFIAVVYVLMPALFLESCL